jgi:hypothetical protein
MNHLPRTGPSRGRRFLVTLVGVAAIFAALAWAPPAAWWSHPATVIAAQDPGISPEALAQIDALIAEKESRTGTALKMDSQLLYELKMQRGQPIANGVWYLETDVPYADDGRRILDVKAKATPETTAAITALGGTILSSADDNIRVQIALDSVEALAALPAVSFVQPRQEAVTGSWTRASAIGANHRTAALKRLLGGAFYHQGPGSNIASNTGQGSRSSEGDVTHLGYAARAAFGGDGTGTKIGVLSDGVTNLAASQAAGDLGTVTVLPGQTGSGDEGTAMLEIIHDLAPGAQLYFATAFTSITSFANNIRALRTAGCDIIVDDVFYYAETPFQDGQTVASNTNGGVVIQAVNDVTAAGAMYFSSAGNSGNLNDGTAGVWEGDFVDGGPTAAPVPAGNRLHSFGGQNFNVLTSVSGNPITLYWADPLGGSANDYDLFRLNAAGTGISSSSTNIQSGTQDPYEAVSGGSTANARIVIVKKASAAGRFLHLNTNRSRLSIATIGTTHGHSAAANAYSVAATPALAAFPGPFRTTNVVETFSSDGPRRVFFQPDGTPITPGNFSTTGGLLRQKPDITAADGVSVTGVGGFGSPFYGTSAAAPHAAAIAALLKSAKPTLTPADIRAALTSSALDIEAPGTDRDSGVGIIMANKAMLAAGIPGAAFVDLDAIQASDNPGNGNGVPEVGEGVRLVLTLANYGGTAASGIAVAVTSASPGATMTIPSASAYPALGPMALAPNSGPLLFTVATDFGCPAVANFIATITYEGAPAPRVVPLSIPIGPPPALIQNTFGGTPTLIPSAVTFVTGQQTGRVFRDGVASVCGSPKPAFPGLSDSATRKFDAYAFSTCSYSVPSCVTVNLGGASAINLFSAAYAPTFNPSNIAQNYRADAGASSSSRSYAFDLAGGAQTFAVNVHEVGVGGGAGVAYTLKVSGACYGTCEPPNHVPVARAKAITVDAGATCTAAASVNDGSYDPDGDPLTITQSPPGPYSLGTTSVLLTVVDAKGATSQATGSVTVVDTTPPLVSSPTLSKTSLWPPDHTMVPITVTYTTSDNCTASAGVRCVITVTSSEPINGLGDGDTAPDWEVIDANHIRLRAERSGKGTGRVYTIIVTCTDAANNRTVRTAVVRVPHDQK